MTVASATILAALVQLALLPPAAAAAAEAVATTATEAPIALPGCPASCGEVSVPYPFGFSPGCYWPGFNLTCDTAHHPPRLLLGAFEVVGFWEREIIVNYHRGSTVSVVPASNGSWSRFPLDVDSTRFLVSPNNELVLYGCNLEAAVLGDVGEASSQIVTSCSTNCIRFHGKKSSSSSSKEFFAWRDSHEFENVTATTCAGGRRCCVSTLDTPSKRVEVELRWLHASEHTPEQEEQPAEVLVAAKGWAEQNTSGGGARRGQGEVPLALVWAVSQGLPRQKESAVSGYCPGNVSRVLCRSGHSDCAYNLPTELGYYCSCKIGFTGNPYLAGGCQDINECEDPTGYLCFGECINKIGSFDCRCPKGSHGEPTMPNGCIKNPFSTGKIIGIAVGSGAGSILLGLIATLTYKRFKYMRARKLKQKYFKQNRGQLLQQLVSQRSDIAERMIIPVDELAKSTNNFDKARELGVGGHGTVYKGILSDLHVVAIKKSKMIVQNEIDEFINEVAILSQINHRNVVKLFGCCLETEVPLLVYEFIPNGTLYHHLHVEGLKSLSWETRLRIATETSCALAYLHSSISTPIIHRDIKSSNILLDDTLTSKVSDFGASRYIPMDKTGLTTRVQGTIGYLDPMYFYTGRLTEKSDVYSFGVILVELLTRKKPFSYLSSDGEGLVAHFVNLLDEKNLVQILDVQVIEEGGKQVQEVAKLAASCIKLRGEDRPTMLEVEHTLKGIQSFKRCVRGNREAEEFEEINVTRMNYGLTEEITEESSRRYSLEQELLMSSRHPR
ncbi:hypothetical protein ACP4OV_003845 [Aristida adscensionis]